MLLSRKASFWKRNGFVLKMVDLKSNPQIIVVIPNFQHYYSTLVFGEVVEVL